MEMVFFVVCWLEKKKKIFDVLVMYFLLILMFFIFLYVVFGEGFKNFIENVNSLENYCKFFFLY